MTELEAFRAEKDRFFASHPQSPLRPNRSGTFVLAYNPYCAYSDYWSCPLTPFENRLKVPIRAGVKMFRA